MLNPSVGIIEIEGKVTACQPNEFTRQDTRADCMLVETMGSGTGAGSGKLCGRGIQ